MGADTLIDLYCHIYPDRFSQEMNKVAPKLGNIAARLRGVRKIHDLDGNEYIDHNLCFGALMAGHCHPAVVKAVEQKLHEGTTFGMPHDMEWELAEEICNRFPVEMCRFGNSGTEATMHAIRLARAATGRDKIIKFEGAYHGLHDSALVSVKPHAPDFGDIDNPTSVSATGLAAGLAVTPTRQFLSRRTGDPRPVASRMTSELCGEMTGGGWLWS